MDDDVMRWLRELIESGKTDRPAGASTLEWFAGLALAAYVASPKSSYGHPRQPAEDAYHTARELMNLLQRK